MLKDMPRAPFLTEFWRDIVSIGSLVVTVVGFGLTIYQLRKTRRAADAARDATTKSINQSRGDFRRYAVSNAYRLFSEVRNLIDSKEWTRASPRLDDLAHQIAQLTHADPAWKVLLVELRTWQTSTRQLAIGSKSRFSSTKWSDFSGRLQEKIDEYYGPFQSTEPGSIP